MMNNVSEHDVQRIVRKPYHRMITGEPMASVQVTLEDGKIAYAFEGR